MAPLASFTSYGRRAGSARVRVFDWLEHLRVDADASTYIDQASNSLRTIASHPMAVLQAEIRLRDRLGSLSGSTAFVSRQASPFSNGKIERRILSVAKRGVYDFDDALMHTPLGASERVWSKRRIWQSSVESADVVVAGNEYLAEAARRFNDNVVIVPSCVAPESYSPKVDYELGKYPVAVWLGSPGTEKYLSLVAEPLLKLHERRGLRLTVVSAGEGHLGAIERMVDRVQWEEQTYQEALKRADFGIMPLDDTAWSRGKCAYKLLQYGAMGLPMIGSGVGVNVSVLAAVDGIVAVTSDDWYSGAETLIEESPAGRARRGRTGRAAIVQNYSFAAWERTWSAAVGLTLPGPA
jgi:glycosyltransferase involved in cell wall biosynthesis